MTLTQPADASGSCGITLPGGRNRDHVKALIIGNEVLSTGGLTPAQVEHMVRFAQDRRDAYGLTSAELPITTDTNSLGNWQNADMVSKVLPLIETYIFFNTYGVPFTSFNFTNQANPVFTPATTTPVKTAVEYRFSKLPAYVYQVQYSADLESWEDIEDPVIGDGETHSVFISFEGRMKSAEHYRLSISELGGL